MGHSHSQEGSIDARRLRGCDTFSMAPFCSCVNWDQRRKMTWTSRYVGHRTQTLSLIHLFVIPTLYLDKEKEFSMCSRPRLTLMDKLSLIVVMQTIRALKFRLRQLGARESGLQVITSCRNRTLNHDSTVLLCSVPRLCEIQRDTSKTWCLPSSSFHSVRPLNVERCSKGRENPKILEMGRGSTHDGIKISLCICLENFWN